MVGALLQTLPELQQQLGQPGRVVEVSREPVDDAGVVLPEGAWSSGTAATGRARSIRHRRGSMPALSPRDETGASGAPLHAHA